MENLHNLKDTIKFFAHNLIKETFEEQDFQKRLAVEAKLDHSFVTKVDLLISQKVKEEVFKIPSLKNFTFLSEEDYSFMDFPSSNAIILDPIDGTSELIKGGAECAVSLAIMSNALFDHPDNFGFIYNPFTGFEIDSLTSWARSRTDHKTKISGLVSNTEWNKGNFNKFALKNVYIIPRGSIAFKLGLLAAGATDFVVSLEPKKLWDIAAGTSMTLSRGFSFFEKGKEIKIWDKLQYEPPLCWCRKENYDLLAQEFSF